MDTLYKTLKTFGTVKPAKVLSKLTTFKIGGACKALIEVADKQKMVELLDFLRSEGEDYMVIGGGSNLLFSDEEFDKFVIKPTFSAVSVKEGEIYAEAGAVLARVVFEASKNSLSGFEWAAGIPGTVGGAVRGNAGAYGSDTSNNLVSVEIYRDGEVLTIAKEECNFSYRESVFKHSGDVVLSACFKLNLGNQAEIMQKTQGYITERTQKFPHFPSAGSFFKNFSLSDYKGDKSILPEKFLKVGKIGAAWFIEQAGMKGFSVGGAKVSDEHANFVINFNNATAQDVLNLIEKVQVEVYNKFGVELEPEVQIIK